MNDCRFPTAEIAEHQRPIGVSAHRITGRLPERLKGSLPPVEQVEAGLSGELRRTAKSRGRKS